MPKTKKKLKETVETLPFTIVDGSWPGRDLLDITNLNGKAIIRVKTGLPSSRRSTTRCRRWRPGRSRTSSRPAPACWNCCRRCYLGVATAGFPNMFVVAGPGSPSVFSNMVNSIEHHVEWIAPCLAHLELHGASRIEATDAAEQAWVEHVNEVANGTLPEVAELLVLRGEHPRQATGVHALHRRRRELPRQGRRRGRQGLRRLHHLLTIRPLDP